MLHQLENPADQNPLLEIETSFSAYINARTRSFKEHIVGGKLDYAFDADFSLRQKINNSAGWSKIYKSLVSADIPNKYKRVFQTANAAGSLLFPNAYEAANICAERLQISVPAVYVRNITDKYEIYSISGLDIDDCIVITSGLYELLSKEELIFYIGRECGCIQNNHCIYYHSAPYFGLNQDKGFISAAVPEHPVDGVMKQLETALILWNQLADITSDRAGIICCDEPNRFPWLIKSIYQKGIIASGNKPDYFLDIDKILTVYETLHITPARNISLDSSFTSIDRRIFAGMEFLNCDIFYNWRPDLNKSDIHAVNKQALEVRCEIIIGTPKEGA